MSYYSPPARIFDVNANRRSNNSDSNSSKNYFNFENTSSYTPPSTSSKNHNNHHTTGTTNYNTTNDSHNNSYSSNKNNYHNSSSNNKDDDDHDSNNNNNHHHYRNSSGSSNAHHSDDSHDDINSSRYYNNHHDNSTHNTSGYSSGFDDGSYNSSSNSIVHEANDDRNDQHDTHETHETSHDVEYSRAPDTFPCGHVLCHNCVRKFMRMRQRSGYSCCPVCHTPIYEDISLHAMGLAVNTPTSPPPSSSHSSYPSSPASWSRPTSPLPTSPSVFSPPPPPSPSPSDPTPISLLTNFDEMVKKFTGFDNGYYGLRRLKDESVRSKSMGMTFTNTQCHLCMENHGTLRVVQEYNQLSVKHERPSLWSNYFYRLQHGKVVTEFHSKVNSSCICVPCTYKELQKRNIPELKSLPNVNPSTDTVTCLTEVGKILAKNSAPIMALQGKNVIEIEHTLQLRQRADHFDFHETADQVERMVKQQEEMLLNIATRQIRDTGRLYHVKESNNVEYDLDETIV